MTGPVFISGPLPTSSSLLLLVMVWINWNDSKYASSPNGRCTGWLEKSKKINTKSGMRTSVMVVVMLCTK